MKIYRTEEELVQFYRENVPRLLINTLPQKKFSIVDLGCGEGYILLALKKKGLLTNASKIIGIDKSKSRTQRLKKKKIKVICSDASNVSPLKNNSIDYIICSQLIEHVKDDKSLLKEINRILKKNGKLYLSSVVKKKYAWYFYKKNNQRVLDPTHLREYSSKNEFINLLKSNGFKILKSKLQVFKFPPIDFLIRHIYFRFFKYKNKGTIYEKHKLLKKLRSFKLPIIGYYNIEVVAKKQ